ncbi:hypothetical protein FYK55_20165 [Roseiconus nitratireducens]|uniref:PH (Pleckstrin Homology) domain-containing protein n=1 Tax=Roseiconus nitratireducens TaxID=2605748 RepID=A0A5M6CZN7_9BACT|nr:hypothetical protein [Roseiconus nitratireducens]KAA5540707.1 hypothetical protein FYK55_20165 [Roseiconus nitratireducens]
MLRAEAYQPFFRKFLWIFLGCVAYSLWCLYDGLIAYPHQLTIAEAYEALPEEGRREAWQVLAAEKGWPTLTPQKSAKEISNNIGSQFFMIVLCMLIGVPALLKWMSGRGAWVEGDATLIRNHKGQEVPIDAIEKIDKRRWESKGIAKLQYKVDGKSKTFVMDDFKFDREAMGTLMRYAEANLSADQVVGDELEREKEPEDVQLESQP